MSFQIRGDRKRAEHIYKTLYLSKELVTQIDRIANSNSTSFNNVVINMIKACLEEGQS